MADGAVRLRPDRLKDYTAQVLINVGMPADDAALVADSLVEANVRGVDSHGVLRLPNYVEKLKTGGTRARPEIRIVRDGPATAVVDGDHGMGQVVGAFAMRLALDKARQTGVGMVLVRNSEHFGAAAYYAMMAPPEGMIGVASTNTPPIMAPWGGRRPTIGNNPIAVAVPVGDDRPIVLDMAMSKVAAGKVRLAAKKGQKIPLGWIVDSEGRPSDNPLDYDGGALLPGDHKLYGLAVIVEALTSALSGAAMLSDVVSWMDDPTRPMNAGHAFMAIRIDAFMPREEFAERMGRLVGELRGSPPAPGVERIMLPGEVEHDAAERRRQGFDVPVALFEDLCRLGEEYGVSLDVLMGSDGEERLFPV